MNSYLLYRVISSYGKLLDRFYLMCFRMVISALQVITAYYKTVIQIQLVMFSVYIKLVVYRKSVFLCFLTALHVRPVKKPSKFFRCQRQRLIILNSPSMTNVTWGYMNAFDWLDNQLRLKKDRTFAMIGQ